MTTVGIEAQSSVKPGEELANRPLVQDEPKILLKAIPQINASPAYDFASLWTRLDQRDQPLPLFIRQRRCAAR